MTMDERYFIDSDGMGNVDAVFKAVFEDGRIVFEYVWNKNTNLWQPTRAVSYYWFEGDVRMDEVSADLASRYLPAVAIDKSVLVKYAPDQLRDENGRFSIDGVGGSAGGKWSRVDPATLVKADVQKFVASSTANGKDLTEKEINAFQRASEKFYSKVFVMQNGSTIIYADKPTPASERAGMSIDKETLSNVMSTVNGLQNYVPLENISVYVNAGRGDSSASCLKTGEGSAIQLNYSSMLNGAISLGVDKETRDQAMPAENAQTSIEFTIAHEWGHAFDNANDREPRAQVAAVIRSDSSLQDGLSKYSGKSDGELFAELFAQNYFEETKGAAGMAATSAVKDLLK